MAKITSATLTMEQHLALMGAAYRTIEYFMDYTLHDSDKRASYKKIGHIRMLRAMFDTDLRVAKEIVDVAFDCWKNEHPLPVEPLTNDQALKDLRDKLTGIDSQF